MREIFKPGKLTFLLDGGAGSSGKGKVASYIGEKYDNWQFCCNSFSSNAAHWVKLEDGRKYLYKTFNSVAYNHQKYEKMYIGPGSAMELSAFFQELEENSIPANKIGISPLTVVIQDIDAGYEKGICSMEGVEYGAAQDGTMKTGSTCSGVGAATARRLLRRPDRLLAKDVPELAPFICDVSGEILDRLGYGQAGFMEVAQGYQLSLMHDFFYPYCTFRNVTTSGALSDMFLPPRVAGPVILNFRTYPIRINSNKYIGLDGHHLTWDEIQAGVPHTVYEGDSGPWYPDQREISWEEVSASAGTDIMEITSKTKLPRRVATFSWANLVDAMEHCDAGEGIHLSVNFADYADGQMKGKRTREEITPQFMKWLKENFRGHLNKLWLVGTSPITEDTIELEDK